MIVSRQHRFIFLKTRKTAGTSIEIALSKVAGPDDVLTAITPVDEARTQGFTGPRNDALPLRALTPRDIGLAVRGHGLKVRNHMSASQVRRMVGRDVWDSYFKFAVDRNPWDAAVSTYYWRTRSGPRPSVSEFINSGGLKSLAKNPSIYRIDGEVAVDRLLAYENLDSEFAAVWDELDLPGEPTLGRAKAATRPEGSSYRDLLADGDAALVSELFSPTIRALNYSF